MPPAPTEPDFQGKVDVWKQEYQDFSTSEKAREYCKIRAEKDKLEDDIKKLNSKLEALSQQMIDAMEREGTNMFRLDTGESLSIKDEPYTSVQDKVAWLQWIKDEGLEDLLSVHYQTMNSMVKNRLETGMNLPPGLKLFIKSSITRRNARE